MLVLSALIDMFQLSKHYLISYFFFFNDTATTEIYTLSLHDALPILTRSSAPPRSWASTSPPASSRPRSTTSKPHQNTTRSFPDWKSTRLNSSHANISYAVFCLKKKKKKNYITVTILIIHIYMNNYN